MKREVLPAKWRDSRRNAVGVFILMSVVLSTGLAVVAAWRLAYTRSASDACDHADKDLVYAVNYTITHGTVRGSDVEYLVDMFGNDAVACGLEGK